MWQEDIFQETPQWGAVMTVQFSLVFSPLWGIWPFLGHTAVPVPHSSLLFRDLLHLTWMILLHNLIPVNMKQSMFKVLWCFLYLKCTLTKNDIECRTCQKKVISWTFFRIGNFFSVKTSLGLGENGFYSHTCLRHSIHSMWRTPESC